MHQHFEEMRKIIHATQSRSPMFLPVLLWEPYGSFHALGGPCHLCCAVQTEWFIAVPTSGGKASRDLLKHDLYLQCLPFTNLQLVDWTLNKQSDSHQLVQVMCLDTSSEKQKWKSVVEPVRWALPLQRRVCFLLIDMWHARIAWYESLWFPEFTKEASELVITG